VNQKKADRLPHEAGLKLLSVPRAPREMPVSALIRNTSAIQDWNLFIEHSIVIACGDSDSMISKLAKAGVRRWISTYNSSFAEPSAMQIQQIRQALANSAGMLDRHIVMEISSCLAIFEK
jgi:hypothetical protein